MLSQYPRSPKLIKGALIQFSAPLFVPVPNIIVFQYNPETMTRTVSPWGPAAGEGQGESSDPKAKNHLAQPFDPEESFDLSLVLDASDALEEPERNPAALISGVADRIAAIEMLMYPDEESGPGGGLGSAVGDTLSGGGNISAGSKEPVPCRTVPVVLFCWGPGRILPVRVESFTIEEQAYSPTLYPIRAKATIKLKVLDERAFDNQEQTAAVKIARMCYKFTLTQKRALATANLNNAVNSVIGRLPF